MTDFGRYAIALTAQAYFQELKSDKSNVSGLRRVTRKGDTIYFDIKELNKEDINMFGGPEKFQVYRVNHHAPDGIYLISTERPYQNIILHDIYPTEIRGKDGSYDFRVELVDFQRVRIHDQEAGWNRFLYMIQP